jgi:hypothetical protein
MRVTAVTAHDSAVREMAGLDDTCYGRRRSPPLRYRVVVEYEHATEDDIKAIAALLDTRIIYEPDGL